MVKSAKMSSMGAAQWKWALLLVLVAIIVVWLFAIWPRREGFVEAAPAAATPKVAVSYYFLENCPWCKKFKPEWEKFKAAVAAEKLAVSTVEIDAEKDSAKVPKEINGFPTITLTDPAGASQTYEGERTSEALLAEVKNRLK